MEFNQRKLTKQEWESTEVPVSLQEQEILRMILAGFHDLNIAFNGNQSLMGFMKITYTPLLENYLYNTYFKTHITKLVQKYNIQSPPSFVVNDKYFLSGNLSLEKFEETFSKISV